MSSSSSYLIHIPDKSIPFMHALHGCKWLCARVLACVQYASRTTMDQDQFGEARVHLRVVHGVFKCHLLMYAMQE